MDIHEQMQKARDSHSPDWKQKIRESSKQGKLISDQLRKAMVQFQSGEVKQGQAARKIAHNIVEMAVNRDPWAIEFLTERLEGKVKQQTDVSVTHDYSIMPELGSRLAELIGQGAVIDIEALPSDRPLLSPVVRPKTERRGKRMAVPAVQGSGEDS